MKTKQDIQTFGIFIPKGFPVVDTESCACVAYYDESNGCSFKPEKGKPYFKPKNKFPIAVSREKCE